MYRLTHGDPCNLPDVLGFVEKLNAAKADKSSMLHKFFTEDKTIFVTRAPGRLDVMGGIADYSGSLMLELPIAESTIVALQRSDSRLLCIVSVTPDVDARTFAFEMPLTDFEEHGQFVSYRDAREYFVRRAENRWAAYVAGAFLVLARERQIKFAGGARIFISSSVPLGKGVSSSAAIEVATMQAIAAAFEISIEPRAMALLCQKVENLVAGAPCGVMDQMSVLCGEAGRLLALLCQPAELRGTIGIPANIAFWGIDSGVRHSVAGADYGSVRAGTFMGYRIIADLAGLTVSQDESGIQIEDSRWQGYLCNMTPSEFEESFARHVPETIDGADFLERYGRTTDRVTQVCPDRTYAVRIPTGHAVYENDRVRRFAGLLTKEPDQSALELLGELMYQSNASYSACGLGSVGTDRLVELVRQAGPAAGLFGAKITGGGSGGTVAVLGTRNARASLMKVAERYARETGYQPYVFEGSSPGCAAFGHLELNAVNQN